MEMNLMKMDVMKKKKMKGFTLIELIVVIAILGILAAIAIPKLTGFQNGARINADISTASTIVTAAKAYVADNNALTNTTLTAVNLATLTSANLIDDPKNAQTNGAAFVLTVGGTIAAPTYTVTATTQIYPTPVAPFIK